MGAWIEMEWWGLQDCIRKSLPLWERGLKSYHTFTFPSVIQSLPLWERGLKFQSQTHHAALQRRSPCGSVDWNCLKIIINLKISCRSPCGSVDWNSDYFEIPYRTVQSLPLWERGLKWCSTRSLQIHLPVAPLVGAWIEILFFKYNLISLLSSLPLWERGLKLSLH